MKPFIKWAGGKRQLLPQILPLFPEKMERYHEPFVGGGAVFFALAAAGRVARVVLSDANGALMGAYDAVKNDPDAVISTLMFWRDTKEEYLALRERFNNLKSDVFNSEVGALLIYLNKIGFNGLYRENSLGEFNVPYGKAGNGRPRVPCDPLTIQAASGALSGASLLAAPFQASMGHINAGDYVYLDPPYAKATKTSFTKYGREDFSIEAQRALADEVGALSRRGAKFVLSNSDVPLIRDLYTEYEIIPVTGRRSINRDGKGRGAVGELLIKNF